MVSNKMALIKVQVSVIELSTKLAYLVQLTIIIYSPESNFSGGLRLEK